MLNQAKINKIQELNAQLERFYSLTLLSLSPYNYKRQIKIVDHDTRVLISINVPVNPNIKSIIPMYEVQNISGIDL